MQEKPLWVRCLFIVSIVLVGTFLASQLMLILFDFFGESMATLASFTL